MVSGSRRSGTGSGIGELSEVQRRRALECYRLLRPHVDGDASLTSVAEEVKLSLRTLQRWVSRYRRFGLAGLSRVGRTDQGKRRRISDELCRLAEGLALQKPPLGPAAIHRELRRVALAAGQTPPGYHTVYSVIRAIPEPLKTLALDGDKAYRETYDLLHPEKPSARTRSGRPITPNSISGPDATMARRHVQG